MPVKKSKEAESTQGLDTFTPLDITTRDIRTAVLMLDSTEDILIAQVCEAIYKYSSLNDANRVELLSLDLLGKLVSKLKSPEKAIRAHAAMCMGSLSAVSESRRAIGELDCFQQLAALLIDEEELITKEVMFVTTLCMCDTIQDLVLHTKSTLHTRVFTYQLTSPPGSDPPTLSPRS